jgi:hypothetical protein
MWLPVKSRPFCLTCFSLSVASTVLLSYGHQYEPMEKGNNVEFVDNKREVPVAVDRALELATKEFLKSGNSIEEYQISVESDNATNEWSISFNPRTIPRAPGGGFYATIKKDTGRLSFKADD